MTRCESPCSVASDVPNPVELADGLGEGLRLGVGEGVAECVGEGVVERVGEMDTEGEPVADADADAGADVCGLTSALGVFFFDDPPKPRMTAKATTATAIAV
jgi:hypothetical protein